MNSIYYLTGIGKGKSIDFKENSLYVKVRPYILFFLFSGIISVLVSPNWMVGLGLFKAYICEPLLYIIVLIHVVASRKDLRSVVNALVVLGVWVSLAGIVGYIMGINLWYEHFQGITNLRAMSVFEYPNAVGLLVAPILGLSVVRLWYVYRKKIFLISDFILDCVNIVLGGVVLYLAQSEGAILGVLVLCMLLFLSLGMRYIMMFLMLCLIVLGGLMYIGRIDSVYEKITLRDFSGTIRRHTYKETWVMLQDHAIFGAGLGGYSEVMKEYHQDVVFVGNQIQPVEIFLYPHTFIYNFWSELGLLGLLLVLTATGYIFFIMIQERQNVYVLIFGGAMIVLCVHGVFDVPFFKNDLALLFWILIIGVLLSQKFNEVIEV